MSDSIDLNRQIKGVLFDANPHLQRQNEQLAVYAVATAERLGFDDNDLLATRITAELYGIPKLPKNLAALVITEGPIPLIVRLCDQFIRMQAVGGQGLSWLQYEAFHHYDRRYVAALRAVEPLISPSSRLATPHK